jgi:hypothetical protein
MELITLTDTEIIDNVLIHLQGYVLEEKAEQSELNDLEYDKKVSSKEILAMHRVTTSYALSYMNRRTLPTITEEDVEVTDPIVTDAIMMWTAGKIWQKYNVRVNNNEDDTTPFGYGDKLVIQAKEILKPYKYYKMMVY